MKLFLDILNFVIFFTILVGPFYSEFSFLATFLPYLATFIWATIVLVIGLKVALSYFLMLLYFSIVFVYFSFGIEYDAIIGMFSGIVASILLYFARGMNLKNE